VKVRFYRTILEFGVLTAKDDCIAWPNEISEEEIRAQFTTPGRYSSQLRARLVRLGQTITPNGNSISNRCENDRRRLATMVLQLADYANRP
jgi:hypothetical protein